VSVIEPAKPFRLERVTVAVPDDPAAKEIVVGLIVNPKSFTETLRVTVPARVSGFPDASAVA